VIGGLDLSNPKKKYNYRGFEISPSSYWLEDFFIDLKKLSLESRKLMFWDQTDSDLLFALRSFSKTKGYSFSKGENRMYWLFNQPHSLSNVWTLDVFNPQVRGINGIEFIRAIPTYFSLVDDFRRIFKCKKLRAYVLEDNTQSLRMCNLLVRKKYLTFECKLKNEVCVNGKDRDLNLFLRSN
tara:strand:- start:454 stop:999 length:546 start_codon:yes stop_codon:yes gene_type:complete